MEGPRRDRSTFLAEIMNLKDFGEQDKRTGIKVIYAELKKQGK